MKSIYRFILLLTVSFTTANSFAQNDLFFSQIKSMIAAGELNQFAAVKGTSTSENYAGTKTFNCSLALKGFTTSLLEVKGKLEFYATSNSYSEANGNAQFLSNPTVRTMAGLTGYENVVRDKGDFESVTALFKTGSDLKIIIIKLRNQGGYTIITSSFKSK